MKPTTFDEALDAVREELPIETLEADIAFYGSRVRGTSRESSDWDVFVMTHHDMLEQYDGQMEKRIVIASRSLDVLVVDWQRTTEKRWKRRELAAALLDARWVPPSMPPRWKIDWDGLAAERSAWCREIVAGYERYWRVLSDDRRDLIAKKLSRLIVRASLYADGVHDVFSTPEIDAKWIALSKKTRTEMIDAVDARQVDMRAKLLETP